MVKIARALLCSLATLIVISASGGHSLTTICVRSSECWQFNSVPCDVNVSLELLTVSSSSIKSNTNLLFDNGTHYMKSELKITHRSNIKIAAVVNNFAKIQCTNESEDAGFRFSEVKNLEMRYLSFSNCKAKDAILTFDKGENVTLLHVEIANSKGAGIQCSCVRGKTNLTHFKVLFSTYTSGTNEFRYESCTKGYTYNLTIHSSVFANNNNIANQSTLYFTSENTNNATVSIEHSTLDNNTGGNLGIHIHGSVAHNQATIKNTNLTRGHARKGGGLYLNIYHDQPSTCTVCHDITVVSIESVWFIENGGSVGGGLFMEQKNHPRVHTSKVIAILNSHFIGNYLDANKRGGVALHSITYILRGIVVQTVPQYKPSLINCTFSKNKVNGTDSASGNGVLFINKNAYFGIKNITVTKNNCSAILAVTSNLLFEGNNELSFNNASSGGGLLLCKNGILYFKPNTTLTIINNTVSHAGGGICVESQCLQTKPRCFYQFEYVNASLLSTIKVVVENNSAGHAGDNLFGGLVDYCYMIDDDDLSARNSIVIYKAIFHIPNNSHPLVSSVASIPYRVCLCDNNTEPSCSVTKQSVFGQYSGETFDISVMTVGQLNGYVPGDIAAKWTDDSDNSIDIKDLEKTQNVNTTEYCKVLSYTPRSSSNTTINSTLQLYAAHSGDISGYLKFHYHRPLNISVQIRECPIGFENIVSKGCTCCFLEKLKDAHCSLSPKPTITISTGWIGYQNGSVVLHESCPYDYCSPIKITMTTSNDFDQLCSYNRTGILCGKCQPNLSMVLGSSTCRQCSNINLLLILVFAVAGMALVFILTTLNLTIAEGTLSGLVFYANIVWYNHSLFVDTSTGAQRKPMLLNHFIALINLDLDVSVCLYDGLNAYQKAWLQFVFPIYIWTISIVIIFLSRKSRFIAKIASKNAVKVLATLVLLSYTKFVQASVRVFAFATLSDCHGDESTHRDPLWLVDANISYFEKKHLILFAVAVLFGVLSLPFMMILLFIKPLLCVSHTRPFWWIQSLKPFLDAYTGPYTDNGRFWPGLLLLARVAISVVGGINSLESAYKQSLVGLMVIMLLFAISKVIRPGLYLKSFQDLLETFFLLNLGILYLLSAYSSYYKQKVHYWILVGLAFLVFIGIVLYHIWLKLRRCTCTMLALEKIISLLPKKKETPNRLSNFPPFETFTEDREPLLADHEE